MTWLASSFGTHSFAADLDQQVYILYYPVDRAEGIRFSRRVYEDIVPYRAPVHTILSVSTRY